MVKAKSKRKKQCYRSKSEFEMIFLPRSYEEKQAKERDEKFGPLGYEFITQLSKDIRKQLSR